MKRRWGRGWEAWHHFVWGSGIRKKQPNPIGCGRASPPPFRKRSILCKNMPRTGEVLHKRKERTRALKGKENWREGEQEDTKSERKKRQTANTAVGPLANEQRRVTLVVKKPEKVLQCVPANAGPTWCGGRGQSTRPGGDGAGTGFLHHLCPSPGLETEEHFPYSGKKELFLSS